MKKQLAVSRGPGPNSKREWKMITYVQGGTSNPEKLRLSGGERRSYVLNTSTWLLHPSIISNSHNRVAYQNQKMKDTIVLFPSIGMGHIIPCVQLAKLFTHHDLSVTIIILETPLASTTATAADSLISRISNSHPSISFHRLVVSSPPPSTVDIQLPRLANPGLLDFLTSLSQTSKIRALIVGMFCTYALDVANELTLPAFIFYASGASCLAAFLYFPTLQSEMSSVPNLKELGEDHLLHFPGLPPVPVSHLPKNLEDSNNEFCKEVLYHFKRYPNSTGIIINTFEQLEAKGVKALLDGVCVPGRRMPPVYPIGPLIADQENDGGKHGCLTWLDVQPKGSVVFLCFGSMGAFSAEQVREIAIGLERSGQRFLWVVRSPPHTDPKKLFEPLPPPDLQVLLPEGFVERNKEMGMVVESWAPQTKVLKHEAVGGFVSHCGWNSTLEAVSSGVAMIAWPLYAEQRFNKIILVEEAKVAVEMEGFDKEMVSAVEVERKVRWLMGEEGGKAMRERVREMKEMAVAAKGEGGSSEKAWMALVRAIKG